MHCRHCCVNAERETDYEMPFDDLVMALNRIINWKPKQISLTGGEPLVRKDIFDILEYLNKKFNGRVTLSTNGTLINEENVGVLIRYLDQIDISIDGVDEATCTQNPRVGAYLSRLFRQFICFMKKDFMK